MTIRAGDALVSVVMIFWNAQEFMEEAVESVLAQTHPAVELLLCDDGSSDGSIVMAQRWAASHPSTVRYLEHPGHAHRGMSSTRNLGIAAARGELIAFLDADDMWEESHLSQVVSLLRSHPEATVVCGGALDWYSWEDPTREDVPSPLPWPPGVVVPPPLMLTAVLRRGEFRTPTCNMLVRANVLDAVGVFEDEFTGMFEDQVFLAKLYLSQQCVVSGARTARYRRHRGSSTARAIARGVYHPARPNLSYEKFLRWVSAHPLVRTGAANEELRDLLAGALAAYDRAPSTRRNARSMLGKAVPPHGRRLLRGAARRVRSLGPVRMGSLRRLQPLSRQFGYERGLPVDRFYIEQFLTGNAHLISGRVLEVGDSAYTRRFGGDRVTEAEVLNIDPLLPETTIVADLASADHVPSSSFDCLVITQTLHLLYDVGAAVQSLHRFLRPGGTVLATFPGISAISTDRWAESWYWALTPLSAARLFGDVFGPNNVEVRAFGNVLTSVAFLEGMAAEELSRKVLDARDPQFPMLVTVRAYRPVTCES